MIVGEWIGWFCREEKLSLIGSVSPARGIVADGVFCLAKPFLEITLVDGLWESVNQTCDLWFDLSEEEDILPANAPRVAGSIRTFAGRNYDGRNTMLRRQVGTRDGRSVVVAAESRDLADILYGLSDFIETESRHGHVVVARF